jgi:capsule polysaccharide export protein KpsE/RkpR
MKNKNELFKNAPLLLDEPQVQQLLAYCESLEDELVAFKFEKSNNKELIMLDMLKEVVKSCAEIQKLEMEHERFGYSLPDYSEAIKSLKSYIYEMNRINKLRL